MVQATTHGTACKSFETQTGINHKMLINYLFTSIRQFHAHVCSNKQYFYFQTTTNPYSAVHFDKCLSLTKLTGYGWVWRIYIKYCLFIKVGQ